MGARAEVLFESGHFRVSLLDSDQQRLLERPVASFHHLEGKSSTLFDRLTCWTVVPTRLQRLQKHKFKSERLLRSAERHDVIIKEIKVIFGC